MMIPYLSQCALVVLATVYLLYFHVHFTVCWPVARQYCVYDVFMMLIFVQLAPENIWRGGSCQLGDVPRVKTANNWKEPVLRSI